MERVEGGASIRGKVFMFMGEMHFKVSGGNEERGTLQLITLVPSPAPAVPEINRGRGKRGIRERDEDEYGEGMGMEPESEQMKPRLARQLGALEPPESEGMKPKFRRRLTSAQPPPAPVSEYSAMSASFNECFGPSCLGQPQTLPPMTLNLSRGHRPVQTIMSFSNAAPPRRSESAEEQRMEEEEEQEKEMALDYVSRAVIDVEIIVNNLFIQGKTFTPELKDQFLNWAIERAKDAAFYGYSYKSPKYEDFESFLKLYYGS